MEIQSTVDEGNAMKEPEKEEEIMEIQITADEENEMEEPEEEEVVMKVQSTAAQEGKMKCSPKKKSTQNQTKTLRHWRKANGVQLICTIPFETV